MQQQCRRATDGECKREKNGTVKFTIVENGGTSNIGRVKNVYINFEVKQVGFVCS